MKIHRDINGIRVSFDLTDDEIVEWVSAKSIDERVVFFKKLAKSDLKSFLEILQILDIFNLLKPYKK
jgi:hypothetical protein